MQKGFVPVLILVGILVLAAIGGAYYLGTKKTPVSQPQTQIQNPVITSSPTAISQPTLSPSPDETANWKTYTDSKYNFSLKYPQEWSFESIQDLNQSPQGLGNNYSLNFKDQRSIWFSIPNVDSTKKVKLQFSIVVHTNTNNWDLNKWINEETYNNGISYLGPTKSININGQTAIEGAKSPDTKDVYVVLPTKNNTSSLFNLILYGNGGAISGGGCEGTASSPCRSYNPKQIAAESYSDNDPYLLKQIQQFDTMLSTFKFAQ